MSQKIKGAVIGVGYLGQFHAQKVKACVDAELVGVFDQYAPQKEKVAQDFQVKAFASLDDVVQSGVEFVSIPAATQAHYELAAFFLNHKVPVLVEKPIAATSEQGEKLTQLAEKNNVVFSVGHIERFNPAYEELITTAQQTKYLEINRLAPFRARGADVSVLHDLMIHDIDLIQYIFKSEILDFEIYGHNYIKETIDDVSVRLKLSNGTQVTINNSRVHPQISRNYRAIQNQRTLFVNTATLECEILTPQKDDPFFQVEKKQIQKVDALQLEINHFVKAVKKECPVKITGHEATQALRHIENFLKRLGH